MKAAPTEVCRFDAASAETQSAPGYRRKMKMTRPIRFSKGINRAHDYRQNCLYYRQSQNIVYIIANHKIMAGRHCVGGSVAVEAGAIRHGRHIGHTVRQRFFAASASSFSDLSDTFESEFLPDR
jgi:hypothetical protein